MLNEWFNFLLGLLSSTNLLWIPLMKLLYLSVLLGQIADGMMIDFIFTIHNCHIAGGMMVEFIFTMTQLCWIGMLLLLFDQSARSEKCHSFWPF